MEYYSQYNTGRTEALIRKHQMAIDELISLRKYEEADSYLMTVAAGVSADNLNRDGTGAVNLDNIEGGPFASIVVGYDGLRPIIVGIGANHVVPECDPSAHGEMSAIRDTCRRLQYSDLSGMTMFTSCECCPQCLSTTIGAGIKRIVYANDRFQAADIGFSDEAQYRLMQDVFKSMSKTNDAMLLSKLGNYDAVVLNGKMSVISAAKATDEIENPMQSLPSMMAITQACRISKHFHLPEDYTLICRKIPHPASFITADWARIGRVRDKVSPSDPSLDKFEKDATKILYIEDAFEEMRLIDYEGNEVIAQYARDILDIYQTDVKLNNINVKIERCPSPMVLGEARKAFRIWKELIKSSSNVKY